MTMCPQRMNVGESKNDICEEGLDGVIAFTADG